MWTEATGDELELQLRHVQDLEPQALRPLLTSYLLNTFALPDRVSVYRVSARELLRASRRFDLHIKLQCIALWKTPGAREWATELYVEHIRAFTGGSFVEEDGRKHSPEDYVRGFSALIASIEAHGFDPSRSLIPVNEAGECIDGAHRLAIAAYFDCMVQVVRLPIRIDAYDYRFFAKRGFRARFSDYVALQYCLSTPGARLVHLHPVAGIEDREVEELLGACGQLVYKKRVKVSGRLPERIVRIYYAQESWIGGDRDDYKGAREHARKAFRGRFRRPAHVYLVARANDDALREAKQKIREMAGKGTVSIHINDDHESTCNLARIWFNDNSLAFLAACRERRFARFTAYFSNYREMLARAGVDVEWYCVDGSAVMSAWGIRDCRDLDYLTIDNADIVGASDGVSCHNHEAARYMFSIGRMLTDPVHHFYYQGMKFLTLDNVCEMKRARSEKPKDVRDVHMIRLWTWSQRFSGFGNVLWAGYTGLQPLAHEASRPFVRVANRVIRLFRFKVYEDPLARIVGRSALRVRFCDWMVEYRVGDVTVARLKRSGRFRPYWSSFLRSESRQRVIETIFDIGAAAGISAMVACREVPGARVMVLPSQADDAESFLSTIMENGLQDRVQWISTDVATGAMPNVDAGWTRLDNPKVDLLNVSEFSSLEHVLSSGKVLIETCRPLIAVNVYPDESDISAVLDRHQEELDLLGYVATDWVGRHLPAAGHVSPDRLDLCVLMPGAERVSNPRVTSAR